jgi:hypothetical protein
MDTYELILFYREEGLIRKERQRALDSQTAELRVLTTQAVGRSRELLARTLRQIEPLPG